MKKWRSNPTGPVGHSEPRLSGKSQEGVGKERGPLAHPKFTVQQRPR